ncbi:helix-turn-helix domain-containing protein [Candidatus Woesearchaeota archaeon]|nr:helix-turn-helix domain-containing protein [Candidatus Woesearchaeota archaeon]
MDFKILENIGLTHSETKVYLALIELGSSSVGPITEKANVASSKSYELLNKLMNKGLVTTYREGGFRYFKAVDPSRLLDFVKEKKAEFDKYEIKISKIIPVLELKFNEHTVETEVEVFKGYKGAETIFKQMIKELKSGDEFLVIGGGDTPTQNIHTKIFFEKVHRERSRKGIKLRIIYNETRRKTMNRMNLFPYTYARYLPFGTPSTINIYNNTTILMSMSPTPAAIRIKDKKISESYKKYFEEMWKIAIK